MCTRRFGVSSFVRESFVREYLNEKEKQEILMKFLALDK
jgi:hypothetical protein